MQRAAGTFRYSIGPADPDMLPMADLAAHLVDLAGLVGFRDNVHFERIDRGSAVVVWRADPVAVVDIEARMIDAAAGTGDGAGCYRKLDDRLAREGRSGAILRDDGSTVVPFPGANREALRNPAVQQQGTLTGELVRVGGKNDPNYAQICDNDGAIISCAVSRDLARDLGKYLHGKTLRLTGTGTWRRQPAGGWTVEKFNATAFEVLDDTPLREVLDRLRTGVSSTWGDVPDVLGELRRLRGGDEDAA